MLAAVRDPVLRATAIADLRPTQMTVGMREVQLKQQAWRDRKSSEFERYLTAHMAPVVLGPDDGRYLVDHHHLALALYNEGVESLFVYVVGDLRKCDDERRFWNLMEFKGWAHPFDAKGKRRSFDDLPKSIKHMKDDPYRSLAGELRDAGGYAKDLTPFSEFIWADFLRERIETKDIEDNFGAALARATELAKSDDADYLPGYCAPHKTPRKRKR